MFAILLLAMTVSAKVTTWRHLEANPNFTFDQYLAEYGKVYMGPEYAQRKAIYEAALATILAHNRGASSWKMGLSEHTDRTAEEWKAAKGYKRVGTLPPAALVEAGATSLKDLPPRVDWREKNVVTPVKNQGGCGSCWAFSATETIESAVAISTGKLLELAPQEFVDCAPDPKDCGGTGGCEGSTQWLAFNYTMTAGATLASDYPYEAHDGTCKMDGKPVAAHVGGYQRLPANDYASLMSAVAKVGPIAISVDASWSFYEEGVYDHECGATIDHAVQLVGYGHDDASGEDYWLVRNSWGDSWGESGYIRIKRFGEGQEPCKTDHNPASGTGCKGGPSEIQVCGLCGILSDSSYPTGTSLA